MEVVIEEADRHDNAFTITSNGAEVLDGTVERHGPAVMAYGQVLGNIVARSNQWISEHRNWLAKLPRHATDEATPPIPDPPPYQPPTTISTAYYGHITSPPMVRERQVTLPPAAISLFSICDPAVSTAVASAVASVSAEAEAKVAFVAAAAQQSVAAEKQLVEKNAQKIIAAIQLSLNAALAALQAQKSAAPTPPPPPPPQPIAAPAPSTNTVTSVLTLEPPPPITNVVTSVYTTTASPPPAIEPPPLPVTNTVTATTIVIVPPNAPAPTTIVSTITVTYSNGTRTTVTGGGGVATPSLDTSLAGVIASASAAVSSANQEANNARASASIQLAQAQSSLSSIASQATLSPSTAGKVVEDPGTFALIVVFSSLGTAVLAVIIFFFLLKCLRKRRDKRMGNRSGSRNSQEAMFRKVTDNPVVSPYDPTAGGFAREKRSTSRGRSPVRSPGRFRGRSTSRDGERGDLGQFLEIPPALSPGNIVGFIVDESRSASRAPYEYRGDMMSKRRSRSAPNLRDLRGDSPTRGRSIIDPVPPIRISPPQPPVPARRTLSRKNTLIYDPDRPNSPPMFGNTFTDRLSRLSRLDMSAVPDPLIQNKSTKSTTTQNTPYTPGNGSPGPYPARSFTFLDTDPREVKFTDSAFSNFSTEYSSTPPSIPARSPNRSSFNRLSNLPSLATMPNTNRSTMIRDPRGSDVLTIGMEIERGTSPSVYSVGTREFKGTIEEGERVGSSKGVIENVNGQTVNLDVLREATERRIREKLKDEGDAGIGTAV